MSQTSSKTVLTPEPIGKSTPPSSPAKGKADLPSGGSPGKKPNALSKSSTSGSTESVSSAGSTASSASSILTLDKNYAKKPRSIVKIVAMVLAFAGLIAIWWSTTDGPAAKYWYSLVAVLSLILTAGLLICYLFHIVELLSSISRHWMIGEMSYYIVMAFMFMSCGLIAAIKGEKNNKAVLVATILAFLCMMAYLIDALMVYTSYLKQKPAQKSAATTPSAQKSAATTPSAQKSAATTPSATPSPSKTGESDKQRMIP